MNTRDLTTPWNPADVSDLPRVVEMMMFYGAAGGQKYTKLTNRFQPYIDMTEQLDLGHAILVGRVEQRATGIVLNGKPADELYDLHRTFFRVVMPVKDLIRTFDDEYSQRKNLR